MSEHSIGRRDWMKTLAAGAALGAMGTAARPVSAATRSTVPTKELGTTGRQIPIILLGAGEGFDPVYDKVLHTAYKEGATYIDTAESYANGQSHVSVGNFIEQIGDRSKLWITSKVALAPATATPMPAPGPARPRPRARAIGAASTPGHAQLRSPSRNSQVCTPCPHTTENAGSNP